MARLKDNQVVCKAQRVFFHAGIRRSGNHAFINWLGNALPPTLLCNDGQLWPTHVVNDEHTKSISPKDDASSFGSIIYGMENLHPDKFSHRIEVVFRSYDCCLEQLRKSMKFVVILRDPFNCFSSIYHHETQGDDSFSLYSDGQFACLWVVYARLYLRAKVDGRVGVDFNRWVDDVGYREEIAKQLDIPFTDAGIDHVPSFGHGSSFFHGDHMSDKQRGRLDRRFEKMLADSKKAYLLWSNTRNDLFWTAARELYPKLSKEVESRLNDMALKRLWHSQYIRDFCGSKRR